MSERDRGLAIAMLVEAFAVKDFTPVRVRVYDKALEAVPVPLLEPMVHRAISTRTFFPKPSELLADAEACRQAFRAAMKYDPEGCERCTGSGWETVMVDQIPRVRRCVCFQAHQDKVTRLGVGETPLSLPAGRQSEMEPVSE
jgi:hypothetical protein